MMRAFTLDADILLIFDAALIASMPLIRLRHAPCHCCFAAAARCYATLSRHAALICYAPLCRHATRATMPGCLIARGYAAAAMLRHAAAALLLMATRCCQRDAAMRAYVAMLCCQRAALRLIFSASLARRYVMRAMLRCCHDTRARVASAPCKRAPRAMRARLHAR